MAAIDAIQANTGKWPGLIGCDYWWFGSGSITADTTFNSYATEYWNSGGLIAPTLSMPNPTTMSGLNDRSSFAAGDLLTPGTTTNSNFMAMLDSVAAGLADLQANGVTVILRPFHEFRRKMASST
jgi:mannan endo-1,4-beta-mannosidase